MSRRKKSLSFLFLLCLICSLALNSVLIIRGGYINKVLVKLNLVEKKDEINWLLKSWENCVDQLELDVDIAFFGDSITYGGDWQKAFPEDKVINLGYPGDSIPGMLKRIELLAACNPDRIYIMAGINGLKRYGEEQSIEFYKQLITEIQAALPDAQIVVQSCLPIAEEKEVNYGSNELISSFNEKLIDLAEEFNITYIDVCSLYVKDGHLDAEVSEDGIHLKEQVYERWYGLLKMTMHD